MGWEDRGYNQGREEMNAYFANPLGLLQFALTIWRSAGLHIKLSFWFLLTCILLAITDIRNAESYYIPLDICLLLGVCLLHEWGHRIFSRWVGGNHWEWILWPLGGLVAPVSPRTAKAVFVANVGGIVFNLLTFVGAVATILFAGGFLYWGTGLFLPIGIRGMVFQWPLLISHALTIIMVVSAEMVVANLYPCYWFDGGHLWQSILWRPLGQRRAGVVTCMAGMIGAVPMFVFSLWNRDILGMLMWALIFADCFRRRQALVAIGDGMLEEDDGPTYDYMNTSEPRAHKKPKKNLLKAARKRAKQDQAEQAKIDAILAKVKEKGLHSLNWWEKRTLRKATQRQRQRDLANRM